MASGGSSDQPPIDTIAGVVADAVRRSLSNLGSQPQSSPRASATPQPSHVETGVGRQGRT